MSPSHSPPAPPSRRNSNRNSNASSGHSMRPSAPVANPPTIPQRLRNDESWVEISSQPSSSSLSSAADEIVTTGLRVQQDSHPKSRRRHRPLPGGPSRLNPDPRQASTSSQEEYEESESEDDQVITSSTEQITPGTRLLNMPQPEFNGGSSEEGEDDDEDGTALGKRTAEPVFTPQPNAFSHPPASQYHRSAERNSYFSTHRPNTDRNAFSARRQSSYSPQTDHDAALRASLTTLLSIGAATARGLPKRAQPNTTTVPNNEQMGLRLVPESELVGGPPTAQANTSRPLTPSTRARSSPSISSQEAIEKGKRKASSSATTKTGDKARVDKKRRKGVQVVADGDAALLGTTFSTWIMSASVLVIFSVVGFGAGYVLGREVGRQEVLRSINGTSFTDGGSCGREMARGAGGSGSLRRLNWRIGGTSITA